MRHIQLFLLFISPLILKAQNTVHDCHSAEVLKVYKAEHPQFHKQCEELENEISNYNSTPHLLTRGAEITIPVVVHIVYNTNTENINDLQVRSQIEVLNKDFNKENNEVLNIPSIFENVAANCGIRFQLASRDPQGLPTTGIVRHQSAKTSWGVTDDIKIPEKGGFAPWAPSKYLNIYVCNMGGKSIGFSSFPGMPENIDGVVIDYKSFGTIGTVTQPFHLGRTCVHEVGHWLGLFHIWGDSDCGNDYIDDTPTHKNLNKGCPSFPHYSDCKGTQSIDMTMNFMDYVNDACMYMFTKNQNTRMMVVIDKKRNGLLTSDGILPANNRECVMQNIQVKKTDAESAQIIWNGLSGVASYTIEYKQISEIFWKSIKTNAPSVHIKNLKVGSAYEFKIKSDCENAQFSSIGSFSTQKVTYRLVGNSDSIKVFPSQVVSEATVMMQTQNESDFAVSITDINGHLKSEKKYTKDTPSVQLDFSGLPIGMYMITVMKNGIRVVNKVIKVRE